MIAPPIARLRVGAHRDFPPFCQFGGGAATGVIVDRVRTALAGAPFELEWHPVALPHMRAALEQGEVDVLCGLGASSDRAEQMDFSNPIVITGGAGFARAERLEIDLEGGPSQWAAAGLRAASPAAGPLLAALRDVEGLAVEDGVDYATTLEMVLDDRIDVAALNFHVGREMATRDHPGRLRIPERPYLQVPLVAAVLKGRHGDFLAALNLGLAGLPAA